MGVRPSAAALLADLGADVVKIEHPTLGDPYRGLVTAGFAPAADGVNGIVEQSNRGKRSVGLDIANDAGRALLDQLIDTADVFLTSFLPGACERLRIDADTVRARNPRVIYARGHGQGRGPDAARCLRLHVVLGRGGVGPAARPGRRDRDRRTASRHGRPRRRDEPRVRDHRRPVATGAHGRRRGRRRVLLSTVMAGVLGHRLHRSGGEGAAPAPNRYEAPTRSSVRTGPRTAAG